MLRRLYCVRSSIFLMLAYQFYVSQNLFFTLTVAIFGCNIGTLPVGAPNAPPACALLLPWEAYLIGAPLPY